MKTIALTGGIGMGKSTVAGFLHELGAAVVDTDDLAREVVEPGQPALEEIKQTFGSHVIGPDGRLLRDELARMVFADSSARLKLEAITHPRIQALWRDKFRQWREEGRKAGVAVIPLLFETNVAEEFDNVVCVACSSASQRTRLSDRRWSVEQIEQRNAAQWPIDQKMARSHFVIWTEGSLQVTQIQTTRVLRTCGG